MGEQHPADTTRAAGQVVGERAAGEVSDVLSTIEHALDQARRAHATVTRDDVVENARHALGVTVEDLERTRKRLTQDTYYAVDERLP